MKKESSKKMSNFFTEKRKKGLVLCCMIALLVTVSYLNVNLTDKQKQKDESVDAPSVSVFFESFKTSTTQTRNEAISCLDSIIESENYSEDEIADAKNKKQKIIDNMLLENKIYKLIEAKGFHNVGIVLSDKNADVVVGQNKLTDIECCKITDILVREAGYKAGNVIISYYN